MTIYPASGGWSLQPLPQQRAQPPPRAKDAGFDGPDGRLQDLGDLVILEALHVPERQRHAALLGQFRERADDGLTAAQGCLDIVGNDEGFAGPAFAVARDLEADGAAGAPTPGEIRARDVHRDAREPRPERALPPEAPDRAIRADEALLREVFGVRVASDHVRINV